MERGRLILACRIKALAAGIWQRADGEMARLAEMHPAHLINAYLGALAAREPAGITQPLAAEVKRRGLAADAYREAMRRDPFWNKEASPKA
jgi:hypothetical protein